MCGVRFSSSVYPGEKGVGKGSYFHVLIEDAWVGNWPLIGLSHTYMYPNLHHTKN